MAFYLSTDSTITSSDVKLGEKTVSSLNINSIKTVSGSFVIPAGITAGNYYVGVIVDSNGTIAETDETNNTKTASSTINIM